MHICRSERQRAICIVNVLRGEEDQSNYAVGQRHHRQQKVSDSRPRRVVSRSSYARINNNNNNNIPTQRDTFVCSRILMLDRPTSIVSNLVVFAHIHT